MLSQKERLAAIALAQLADLERERTLQRGYIMVNLAGASALALWTPVNLDAAIIDAAEDFRRAAMRADSETASVATEH